jgi:hypothetical protein
MPGEYPCWTARNDRGESRFEVQGAVLREVLAAPTPTLADLFGLMRARGEPCVYLCGTRRDHAYALGSDDLGVALSVLPEDGAKAAEPGYHPGGTEVYVVIEGTVVLEVLADGVLERRECPPHGVLAIPPGRCHRVPRSDRRAASLVVKTGIRHEPAVVRCAQCTYYADPRDCTLHRSWADEADPTPG